MKTLSMHTDEAKRAEIGQLFKIFPSRKSIAFTSNVVISTILDLLHRDEPLTNIINYFQLLDNDDENNFLAKVLDESENCTVLLNSQNSSFSSINYDDFKRDFTHMESDDEPSLIWDSDTEDWIIKRASTPTISISSSENSLFIDVDNFLQELNQSEKCNN